MSRDAVAPRAGPRGAAPPKLAVRDLVKTRRGRRRREITAADDVTFEVRRRASSSACSGPRGCGKTTILNILAGLDEPTSGQALLDGDPSPAPAPTAPCSSRSRRCSPGCSVRGNVELALKLVGVAGDANGASARDALARERPPDGAPTLSRTSSRRACVSGRRSHAPWRATPTCSLGDEPFGALDAQARELLQDEVQRVWVEREGRKTFVFVTHNVREAALLADRVLVMSAAPGPAPRGGPDPRTAPARPRRRARAAGRLGDPRVADAGGGRGVAREMAREGARAAARRDRGAARRVGDRAAAYEHRPRSRRPPRCGARSSRGARRHDPRGGGQDADPPRVLVRRRRS